MLMVYAVLLPATINSNWLQKLMDTVPEIVIVQCPRYMHDILLKGTCMYIKTNET